jgi:hypothetical protein
MGTIVLSVSFLRGMFYTGRFESQLNWFEVICLDSVLLLFCCLALYWFYCRMQRLIEVRTLQEYEYEAQMGKIIKLKWLKY